VEDILVVVVGLVVVKLVGDEFCGKYVQEEKEKGFPVVMKRKFRAAMALVCLKIDRHVNVTSLKLARENGQGRYL
jgi:hypothetical protein